MLLKFFNMCVSFKKTFMKYYLQIKFVIEKLPIKIFVMKYVLLKKEQRICVNTEVYFQY